MKDNPLIVWEKWVDPFGGELDDAKWTDYDNEIDELDDEDIIDEETGEYENFSRKRTIKAIATPMGLIPYNELTAPGKIFNFWVGHTNFDITKNIASTIEKCEGIEILDIFSRYRFRIAVGKCFNDSEIMTKINDKIYEKLNGEY
jgi:hypothetical protein